MSTPNGFRARRPLRAILPPTGFMVAFLAFSSGTAMPAAAQVSDHARDVPAIDAADIASLRPVVDESRVQTAGPVPGDLVARIATDKGDIWLKLFPALAPRTVENFIGLARRDYYDGILFHRVIPDFMIQTGDPSATGRGGESLWGGRFGDEFHPDLIHLPGALSMANAGPDTNGSQFFIVQKSDGTPWLDNRHSVFGQTFAGHDVIDAVVHAGNANSRMNDVAIYRVR